MIANLPLLFAGGCPTSLTKMVMHELECFITFLVHCSWGHDTAKSIQQPQWWPPDIPFSDPFYRPSSVPKDWTSKLRDLITRCYTYHNSEFLLKFSEELSLNPPSKLQYVDNCDRTTSLYERTSGKLLVTFRNENMLYDRKAEGNRKCLLPKRYVTSESVVENIIADIYLCDTCDEVFDSLQEIRQHERECSERPRSPDILCLSPEPYEEEEEVGQERFMEIMGLRHVAADVQSSASAANDLNDKNNCVSKHRQRRSTVVSNLSYFPFSSLTGRKFNKLRHQTEESSKRETLDRYCPAPPLCLEVPRWLSKPRPHVYPAKYKKTDNYWNRYHRFPHQRNKLILELNSYLRFRDCKAVSVKVQPMTDKQVTDYLEELSKQKIANEKARAERELAESSYDHDIEFVCVSVCANQSVNRKRYSNKSVHRTIKIEPNSGPSKTLSSSSIDIIDLCSDDDDQVETSENADPFPVACHASGELKSHHLSLAVTSESNNSIKDIPHLEAAYPTLIDDKTPLSNTPCGSTRNSDSKVFPLKEYHINSPNSIILID